MRLINADALKSYLQEKYIIYDHILEDIDAQPTIDAEPVRHGKWIPDAEDWRHQIEWVKCSLCDFPTSTAYKYCPNCGARMDKEEL